MNRHRTLLVLAVIAVMLAIGGAPGARADVLGPAYKGEVTASPNPRTFESTRLGEDIIRVVTVKNTTNGRAQVFPTYPASGPFTDAGFFDGDCQHEDRALVMAKGASCTLHIKFAPTEEGTARAEMTLAVRGSSSTPGSYALPAETRPVFSTELLKLKGTGEPMKSTYEPSTFSFGTVQAGETRYASVVVTNKTDNVFLQYDVVPSAGFTRVDRNEPGVADCQQDPPAAWSYVVPPRQRCVIWLSFRRVAPGSPNGTVTVKSYNAGSSPAFTYLPRSGPVVATKSLTVTAHVPEPTWTVTPGSLSYDDVSINGAYVKTVTVKNTSKVRLRFGAWTDFPQFAVLPGSTPGECLSGPPSAGQSRSVGPRGSCTIRVAFHSDVPGRFRGLLTVVDYFTDAPPGAVGDLEGLPYRQKTVDLSGRAPEPDIKVTPASVNFGRVDPNTEPTRTITVTNQEDFPLQFQLSIPGLNFYRLFVYAASDECQSDSPNPGWSLAVPPGGTCKLKIGFSPLTRGRKTAVAELDVWNAVNAPPGYSAPTGPVVAIKQIHLSGTGTGF